MRQRCSNPNAKNYERYGGRGIRVCAAWQASFLAFIRDIGPKPDPSYELDRIDNDGNYEPGNVRWATLLVQMNNTRKNVFVNFGDARMTLAQLARETKIPYRKLLRLRAKGLLESTMTSEQILSALEPLLHNRKAA